MEDLGTITLLEKELRFVESTCQRITAEAVPSNGATVPASL